MVVERTVGGAVTSGLSFRPHSWPHSRYLSCCLPQNSLGLDGQRGLVAPERLQCSPLLRAAPHRPGWEETTRHRQSPPHTHNTVFPAPTGHADSALHAGPRGGSCTAVPGPGECRQHLPRQETEGAGRGGMARSPEEPKRSCDPSAEQQLVTLTLTYTQDIEAPPHLRSPQRRGMAGSLSGVPDGQACPQEEWRILLSP